MTQHNNFINGEWVAGASYTPNINPSNLSDVIGEYAQADAAQVETAVAAAKAAVRGQHEKDTLLLFRSLLQQWMRELQVGSTEIPDDFRNLASVLSRFCSSPRCASSLALESSRFSPSMAPSTDSTSQQMWCIPARRLSRNA